MSQPTLSGRYTSGLEDIPAVAADSLEAETRDRRSCRDASDFISGSRGR
jgi:hypothetical protein